MKISYLWLKDYLSLRESPALIAERLSSSGVEVEHFGPPSQLQEPGLLMGTVLSLKPLKGQRSLQEVSVSVGKKKPLDVICRSSSLATAHRVIIATPGTQLQSYDGKKQQIAHRKFQEHSSEGMLCSAYELGIGPSQSHPLSLQSDLPDGTPAAQALMRDDYTVFEISLTPNRGDLVSHYGLARELAVLLGRQVRYPQSPLIGKTSLLETQEQIHIQSPDLCPRYAALRLSGLRVAPSPLWLQQRLFAIGLPCINNIVDITNYVCHAVGQPLHAFDWDKIEGRIEVRASDRSFSFHGLNGKTYPIEPGDLLICDQHRPLALAGILGGLDSSISENTSDIFLESAYFSAHTIAKTSRRLGLQTDASFRYARQIDPEKVYEALCWAASLLEKYAHAQAPSQGYDLYPRPLRPARPCCRIQKLNQLAGCKIPRHSLKRILKALDIEILKENKAELSLQVPLYRSDVLREVDVFEEILRIYGYDRLQRPLELSYRPSHHLSDPSILAEKAATELLISEGFWEIITNALLNIPPETDPLTICADPPTQWARITAHSDDNPRFLRPSLFPSGIDVIRYNLRHKQSQLRFFELGSAYWINKNGSHGEEKRLAIYMCTSAEPPSWRKPAPIDFYDLSSIVLRLLDKLGLRHLIPAASSNPWFSKGIDWYLNGQRLASGGLIKSRYLSLPTYAAELYWPNIKAALLDQPPLVYKATARSPEVKRELSLVLDQSINYAQIDKVVKDSGLPLIQDTSLLNIYEGPPLAQGQKSYALRFTLQGTQTLTDDQISASMQQLIHLFEEELRATIRI